jgi:hypothetical protein
VVASTSAADSFASCWQKLDRARKHADDLSREIRDFFAASPFQLEPAVSDSAGVTHVTVRHLDTVPVSIALTAGDAAHNIRSALDHFAWAAVSPSAQGPRTCFPLGTAAATRDPVSWRRHVEQRLNGASPELITAVAAMEPWESGSDESLWAVHELDRLDKHRLVLSAAVTLGRIELHGDSYELTTFKKYSGFDLGGPLPMEPAEWTPVEEGSVLAIPLTGPEVGGTGTTLRFDVVLAEPETLRRTSAATAMTMLAHSTEKVIKRLIPLA